MCESRFELIEIFKERFVAKPIRQQPITGVSEDGLEEFSPWKL